MTAPGSGNPRHAETGTRTRSYPAGCRSRSGSPGRHRANTVTRCPRARTPVAIRYVRRSGEVVNTNVTLDEDPRIEVVAIEKTGGTLTDEQRRLRELWLSSPKR